MDFEQAIVRLASSTKAFEDYAAEHAGALVSFLTPYAEDLCESEIEKVFFLAWTLRLEKYKLFGSSHGGKASYWHNSPDDKEGSIEAPQVFNDPVRQHDVVNAQVRILDYRVDFLLRRFVRHDIGNGIVVMDAGPKVIVECDGHDFHERTKEQAARDKERDRLLHTAGYVVMRFTGSELWKNPESCVEQVDELMEQHIARLIIERRGRTKKT